MHELHTDRMLQLIQSTYQHSRKEPYGCSIYDAKGEEIVTEFGDNLSPINHAEMKAINKCANIMPHPNWATLILYTTGEPCCMCAAACCWAKLNTIVFSVGIPYMAALWGIESSLRAEEIIITHPHKPTLISSICETEGQTLFTDYRYRYAEKLFCT